MTESFSDRRDFILGASAVLAGLTVRRLAAEDDLTKRTRVAVVGTGGRGSDLIRKLTTVERADLVAICDDYPPHLEQGVKYAGGGAKAFADYSMMLREVKPEAVVVATPLNWHFSMCSEALDRGCAVFCEKTMCHTIEQAERLAERVEKSEAIFQVGLQRRANPVYHQAAAMVKAGMLGKVSSIKCQWNRNNNWRRPVPVPRPDPRWAELERRLNWRLYWDYSQGLMAELASHQLDVANWVLGAVPRRVIASGGIDHWRDGREVYDNVHCLYDYELKSGSEPPYTVRVTYSSIQNNAFEGASELIMGTKGTLYLTQQKGLFYREMTPDDPQWKADGRENASIVASGKTLKMSNDPWAHRGKPYEIDPTGDDTRQELIEFLKAVQDGNPETICDARAGLENARTVLSANRAIREGTAVEM